MKNKKLFVFIIIVCIIFVFLWIFKDKIQKIIYPKTYEEIITVYSNKYNVDENLIFAVIKSESDFKVGAVSKKGAIGLMQFMEETAKEVCIKNNISININNINQELKQADKNINIGTKYLSMLLQKYENIELTLAAYNAGSGNVDKWIQDKIIKSDGSDIENIPYKETNNYIRRILRDYKIYQNLYKND